MAEVVAVNTMEAGGGGEAIEASVTFYFARLVSMNELVTVFIYGGRKRCSEL